MVISLYQEWYHMQACPCFDEEPPCCMAVKIILPAACQRLRFPSCAALAWTPSWNQGRSDMNESKGGISLGHIERVILTMRGQRIMLDRDLAMLYAVPIGVLNQ